MRDGGCGGRAIRSTPNEGQDGARWGVVLEIKRVLLTLLLPLEMFVAGGTWATINGLQTVTVIDANTIDLQGVNATGFGVYTGSSASVHRPIPTNGSPVTVTLDAGGMYTLNVQPAA